MKDLKLHKVCGKFMLKILSDDQRQFRVRCCTDILKMIKADSGFLNNIVTCDKSWVFTYDRESKHQSAQWKHRTSSGQEGKDEQATREGHGHSFF